MCCERASGGVRADMQVMRQRRECSKLTWRPLQPLHMDAARSVGGVPGHVLTPQECEFLAEDELVQILPTFEGEGLNLIRVRHPAPLIQ